MRTAAEIARDNDTVTYAAGTASPVARSRYDCAWLDHPPATYNPLMNLTWCLCGVVRQPGNHGSTNGDWHLPPMMSAPPVPWVYGMDPDPAAVPDRGFPMTHVADARLQMRVEPNIGGRPCPPGSSPTSTAAANGSRPTTASTPTLSGRGGQSFSSSTTRGGHASGGFAPAMSSGSIRTGGDLRATATPETEIPGPGGCNAPGRETAAEPT